MFDTTRKKILGVALILSLLINAVLTINGLNSPVGNATALFATIVAFALMKKV